MPELFSRHELALRPEYKLLTLRDVELDARLGADDAIVAAGRSIAAPAPYEIWVKVAQLDLPVLAEVEVWDIPPVDHPGPRWTLIGRFPLPFPSAHPVLGDGSGQVIDGPWLPQGPGNYLTEVWSAGRELALMEAARIDELTQHLDILEKIEYQSRHGSGIERYLFRLSWLRSLE
jgi:hypothetical protein